VLFAPDSDRALERSGSDVKSICVVKSITQEELARHFISGVMYQTYYVLVG
jgi:hypothetical protein